MNHTKRLLGLLRRAVGAAVIAMALGRAGVLRADEKTANTRPVGERIEPFKIAVEDTVLRDLQDRLARTRWPDQIDGTGWEYGIPAVVGVANATQQLQTGQFVRVDGENGRVVPL